MLRRPTSGRWARFAIMREGIDVAEMTLTLSLTTPKSPSGCAPTLLSMICDFWIA